MRPCQQLLLLLGLALVPSLFAQAPATQTSIHWLFDASETWQGTETLTKLGWEFNAAALLPDAVTIDPTKFNHVDGALELNDVTTNDFPVASLAIPALATGTLDLKLGTVGEQDQDCLVELLCGNRAVVRIMLKNNTSGSFITGSGETPFADTASMFRDSRLFHLSWKLGANATTIWSLSFTPLGEGLAPVVVKDAPALTAGPITGIRFKSGFGGATKRGLLIDELNLVGSP